MKDSVKHFFAFICAASSCASSSAYAEPAQGGESGVFYKSDIAPIFASGGCAAAKCHGAKLGAGGLKLALFSGDDRADFETLAVSLNSRLIDRQNPKFSLLLKKISGEIPHKGGKNFDKDSDEYKTVERWIAEGARFKSPDAADIAGIEISPKKLVLKEGESAKIKITARYEDGKTRDVSSLAKLSASGGCAKAGKNGEARFERFGEGAISASFMRKFASIPVICARPAPENFPKNTSANPIDKIVHANLEAAGIIPSEICTDSEFLRRVYLDATGLLPSPKTAEAFLRDKSKDKRAALIESLLKSPEFTDMLAMRLSDALRIKSEFPSNLWPNAAQAYYVWLRDCLAAGKPYDIIAREMLLSSGSNFKSPPSNFYRAVSSKNAEGFSESVALVFMGLRTNCIKCHAHPYEDWTMADNKNFAAIFKNLSFKKSKEWKEEILCVNVPDFADGAKEESFKIFGETIKSPAGADYREAFAEWLLDKKNPYFAKIAVSRIWHWIFSKGLVEPADDIRPNNVSANAEILDILSAEFINSGFDLKSVYRLIFNSQTYQRSSVPNATNKNDEKLFSRHIPSRLTAESLNDIISGSLGVYQPFKSITPEPYAFWPEDFRAIKLHDGSVSNPFLTLFGKPGRNSSHLNDRSDKISMQQLLHLMGSANITSKLNGSRFLRELSKPKYSNDERIKTLYLTFLCRPPTAREAEISKKALSSGKPPLESLKDLTWAIINTKEFLYKI